MKTIAIDFDGVVHRYSKGWQDGSIYDDPIKGSLEAIKGLIKEGYGVFIFSTRNPIQIKKWLKYHLYVDGQTFLDDGTPGMDLSHWEIPCQIIPFWRKFWNKTGVLGITNKKLPAYIYIDDRGYEFKNWNNTLKKINDTFRRSKKKLKSIKAKIDCHQVKK